MSRREQVTRDLFRIGFPMTHNEKEFSLFSDGTGITVKVEWNGVTQ